MNSPASEEVSRELVPDLRVDQRATRFGGKGPDSLRSRTARGTIVNGLFLIGLNGMGLLKGFAVAGFLTAQDYGVWGLLVISVGTLLWLGQLGITDKYIQQDDPDQERAFQIAFTLQSMLAVAFMALFAVAIPLYAIAYNAPKIVAPGFALATMMPAIALQTPLWVFLRRMDFLKQRTLEAFEPIVGFIVAIALAIAGFGYWSLVIGTIAGSWTGALVAVRASPYPVRWRWEREVFRDYVSFSWPLMVKSASGVLVAQVPIVLAQRSLGLAAVGAMTLAGTIALYAARVDDVVTATLYPAVCAVKDRADLLLESFTKSNRLALLWGFPFGAGVALFAPDLVSYVIGEKWRHAVLLIQIYALIAGFNQIGFNWESFYQAVGRTRPMAVVSVTLLVAVMGIAVPLLLLYGLTGFGIGMAIATGAAIVLRGYYLTRIFPALDMLHHVARAIAPTVLAAAAVVVISTLLSGRRTAALAAAEVALYVVVVAAVTIWIERPLLGELIGYLRRRQPFPAGA